jgi:hypothetical protein
VVAADQRRQIDLRPAKGGVDAAGLIDRADAETKPGMPLRVGVRDQDAISACAGFGRQIDGDGRFADAALLVRDREHGGLHEVLQPDFWENSGNCAKYLFVLDESVYKTVIFREGKSQGWMRCLTASQQRCCRRRPW